MGSGQWQWAVAVGGCFEPWEPGSLGAWESVLYQTWNFPLPSLSGVNLGGGHCLNYLPPASSTVLVPYGVSSDDDNVQMMHLTEESLSPRLSDNDASLVRLVACYWGPFVSLSLFPFSSFIGRLLLPCGCQSSHSPGHPESQRYGVLLFGNPINNHHHHHQRHCCEEQIPPPLPGFRSRIPDLPSTTSHKVTITREHHLPPVSDH